MTALGIDWAGNGWVAASHDAGRVDVEFYPTVLTLWRAHSDAAPILIDVPVGLRETGKRGADQAAAAMLGGRRAGSVFFTPTRPAVHAPNIETAKQRQEPASFGVQNQAWAIVPRIREVDGFLQEYAENVGETQFLEAHPELCFAGLDDGTPIEAAKTTDAGREARLDVLEAVDEAFVAAYHEAVETLTEPTYAPMIGASKTDDILDALALAATAAKGAEALDSVPDDPEYDPVHDREIRIVYP